MKKELELLKTYKSLKRKIKIARKEKQQSILNLNKMSKLRKETGDSLYKSYNTASSEDITEMKKLLDDCDKNIKILQDTIKNKKTYIKFLLTSLSNLTK